MFGLKLGTLVVYLSVSWNLLEAQAKPSTTSQESNPQNSPTPTTFVSDAKKAIVVVHTECESGDIAGTAFFVGLTDPRVPDSSFVYLVTNKHVALPHIEDGHPCQITKQQLQMTLKAANPSDGAKNYFVNVTTPWLFHPDPSVDLAVLPYAPDQNIFDYRVFSSSMLAASSTITEQRISEGDPVFYIGYFYQLPGARHIQPIMRQGIVAMMPDEPVITTLKKPGLGYLADAHVFGGNSGSPMFINLGGIRNGSLSLGMGYKILGVVSGMEPEDNGEVLRPVVNYSNEVKGNSGVSFVVPAFQVLEILNNPTLASARDAEIAKRKQ